ncbi:MULTISPECIES: cytochrome o ubiquinol oxidase subunit IV [Cobetia]|uniref:Cytochrome bo(3) ubiquinol oxidase subunit 4 n=1 Tax=Cobetia crustatorum TaxID=553385 RepID=A0A558HUD1_9GAMM|nr:MULTISPECIES: cytochrome o ubiquinol oxidase subunit IV [Cobetia]TVU72714.1 cytochrome o ubiquinol oxidase subunit IV [Cobetia crustatorum]
MSHSNDHHNDSHGSVKQYVIGLILSIILTIIPFGMVMLMDDPGVGVIWAIFGFAIAQVFVQLYFFLHLDGSKEQSWNVQALLFTLVIVGIVVGGSLWIMVELNQNMMPI